MRFIILTILITVLFSSCRTQEQNEYEADKIAQERINEIDFSTIDTYPLFDGCDELEDVRTCFNLKLQEQIQEKLKNHQLQFDVVQQDSLSAIIQVDINGVVSYQGLQDAPQDVKSQKIDSLLSIRLQQICKINPAYKHGTPVLTSYRLPVIIKAASGE